MTNREQQPLLKSGDILFKPKRLGVNELNAGNSPEKKSAEQRIREKLEGTRKKSFTLTSLAKVLGFKSIRPNLLAGLREAAERKLGSGFPKKFPLREAAGVGADYGESGTRPRGWASHRKNRKNVEKSTPPVAIVPKVNEDDPTQKKKNSRSPVNPGVLTREESSKPKTPAVGKVQETPGASSWGRPFKPSVDDSDSEVNEKIVDKEKLKTKSDNHKLSYEEISAFMRLLESPENQNILKECGIKMDQKLLDTIYFVDQLLGSRVNVSNPSFKANVVPAFLKRLAGYTRNDWKKIVNNSLEDVKPLLGILAYLNEEDFSLLAKGLK